MNIETIQFDSLRDDFQFSDEYAEFIMENNDGTRLIYNGDSLVAAQEDGFLFLEFLESIGVTVG